MRKPSPEFEFKPPVVQGAFDAAPGTPPTAIELEIADKNGNHPGQTDLEKQNAVIDAELQTPEQLAAAQEQARALARRFGQNGRNAA